MKNAAFPIVDQFEGSEEFLIVSSFGAMSSGKVYVVPNITEAVESGNVSSLKSIELDTPNFSWPNIVRTVPQDVFGG